MILMKWVVDRLEENIAVLENIDTKEKQEIDVTFLNFPIHDGSILIFENGSYRDGQKEEILRRKEIEERFLKLRKKDS